MLKHFCRIIKEWSQLREFYFLPQDWRSLVFYAEDEDSWPHLGPIIEELLSRGQRLCYLTSSLSDPFLKQNNLLVKTFYIGNASARTFLFMILKAKVMVMTMPDLQNYHIKRSLMFPVHYAYVFHSIVSTHMIYRPRAFDHFDTIFCVGPHHVKEIRQTEQHYQLKPKILVEHGYGRLDTLLNNKKQNLHQPLLGKTHVLVAPSWGTQGLLETHGEALIRILLNAGFEVTLRPHTMTTQLCPETMKHILQIFQKNPEFHFEKSMSASDSLQTSHCMISDWSGSALEYSFVFQKPVLFVDIPKKINNPLFQDIDSMPVEISLRNQIGEVIPLDSINDIPSVIRRLCMEQSIEQIKNREICQQTVFHVGKSAFVAADYLCGLVGKELG